MHDIAAHIDGYDTESLPVAAAQAFIAQLVPRVGEAESVPLKSALGRVLASEHGECAPAPLERLAHSTLQALHEMKHPQADKPAPRTSKDSN